MAGRRGLGRSILESWDGLGLSSGRLRREIRGGLARKGQLLASLGRLGGLLTYFLDIGVEVDGTFNQLGEFDEKIVEVYGIPSLG